MTNQFPSIVQLEGQGSFLVGRELPSGKGVFPFTVGMELLSGTGAS